MKKKTAYRRPWRTWCLFYFFFLRGSASERNFFLFHRFLYLFWPFNFSFLFASVFPRRRRFRAIPFSTRLGRGDGYDYDAGTDNKARVVDFDPLAAAHDANTDTHTHIRARARTEAHGRTRYECYDTRAHTRTHERSARTRTRLIHTRARQHTHEKTFVRSTRWWPLAERLDGDARRLSLPSRERILSCRVVSARWAIVGGNSDRWSAARAAAGHALAEMHHRPAGMARHSPTYLPFLIHFYYIFFFYFVILFFRLFFYHDGGDHSVTDSCVVNPGFITKTIRGKFRFNIIIVIIISPLEIDRRCSVIYRRR